MHPWALLILVLVLFEYALSRLADVLNLRALDPQLPSEFADVYDAERYAKSQEYTRARTRFGLLPATFDLALLLTFWAAGGFGWLDRLVNSWDLGPVPSGLAYLGLLMAGKSLLDLPFELYSTFVLEARFGFNRTDLRTFILDRVKGLVLGLLLGGPLLALILYLLASAGPYAWLYCFGVLALFQVVMLFVAPTWIFPLFLRFSPLENATLAQALEALAARTRFPLDEVYVVDGSRRSSKANAFFTGFGKRKRIALYDTLLESHPISEIVAVLAHEIGHFKKRHVLISLALGLAHSAFVFWLLGQVLRWDELYAAFGIATPSVHTGLVFFGLLYTPVELVFGPLMQALSRRNEFEADAFARESTGTPEELVSALKRLSADSLTNLTPHPLYVALHHGHPPVLARIAALRA